MYVLCIWWLNKGLTVNESSVAEIAVIHVSDNQILLCSRDVHLQIVAFRLELAIKNTFFNLLYIDPCLLIVLKHFQLRPILAALFSLSTDKNMFSSNFSTFLAICRLSKFYTSIKSLSSNLELYCCHHLIKHAIMSTKYQSS